MARKVLLALAALVAVAAVAAAALPAWRVFMRVEEARLGDGLFALQGGGGNSLVLVTSRGAVVVDTKFAWPAKSLFATVRELGAGSVRAIINTHHHADHTHGNPRYPPGTPVYAAAPAAQLLQRFDADFWAEEPARSLAPNRTFEGATEIDFGEEVLRLVQLPPGHTGGGDIAVLFTRRRVLHAGDAFVNGFYPNVDLRSGGSIPGMLAAIERILALDFDVAVPGHGPIGTRADVEKARDYLVALWSYAREAARARRTVEEALRDAPPTLRGLQEIPFLTSLEKNLTWAMQKAAPK